MRNPDRAHLAQGHDQEGGGCRRPRLAPARWRLRPSAGLQPRTHGAPCGPRAPMWPLRPLAAPAVTLAPRARLTIPRHYLLLTTHYSLLTTHYSLGPRARLPRHSLLLTTYYSLLTTHYSLLQALELDYLVARSRTLWLFALDELLLAAGWGTAAYLAYTSSQLSSRWALP